MEVFDKWLLEALNGLSIDGEVYTEYIKTIVEDESEDLETREENVNAALEAASGDAQPEVTKQIMNQVRTLVPNFSIAVCFDRARLLKVGEDEESGGGEDGSGAREAAARSAERVGDGAQEAERGASEERRRRHEGKGKGLSFSIGYWL